MPLVEAEEILQSTASVLVVDWPSRDVPETLARAGYSVFVKAGPEPDSYSVQEVRDAEVVARDLGRPPEHVDLVYCHRPLDELAAVAALAKRLGAQAVWCQTGLASATAKHPRGCWVRRDASRQARRLVESAGLRYIDDIYIADVVRRML
jgi:predicted CoA-binding protein